MASFWDEFGHRAAGWRPGGRAELPESSRRLEEKGNASRPASGGDSLALCGERARRQREGSIVRLGARQVGFYSELLISPRGTDYTGGIEFVEDADPGARKKRSRRMDRSRRKERG